MKVYSPLLQMECDVIENDADLSPCLQYRYTLSRIWDGDRPAALFVMLNPSTADAVKNDPTIRRCINFGRSWGMGGIVVVNLFAYRAPKPAELVDADDPVGPGNNEWIARKVQECRGPIVAAWGSHKMAAGRVARVRKIIGHRDVMCLKKSKGGQPWHPLYVRADTLPMLLWEADGSFESDCQRAMEEVAEGPEADAVLSTENQ